MKLQTSLFSVSDTVKVVNLQGCPSDQRTSEMTFDFSIQTLGKPFCVLSFRNKTSGVSKPAIYFFYSVLTGQCSCLLETRSERKKSTNE